MRVIVVGGGIMGLGTAWALCRAGHEPVVYEQGRIPNPLASSCDEHRLTRFPYGAAQGRGSGSLAPGAPGPGARAQRRRSGVRHGGGQRAGWSASSATARARPGRASTASPRTSGSSSSRAGAAWILAGFSGHGFKFGAVIGEAITEALAGGRPAATVTAWAAGRA
jgi:glycine/D-amino acid oxidase-like deaminating enzyme